MKIIENGMIEEVEFTNSNGIIAELKRLYNFLENNINFINDDIKNKKKEGF